MHFHVDLSTRYTYIYIYVVVHLVGHFIYMLYIDLWILTFFQKNKKVTLNAHNASMKLYNAKIPYVPHYTNSICNGDVECFFFFYERKEKQL